MLINTIHLNNQLVPPHTINWRLPSSAGKVHRLVLTNSVAMSVALQPWRSLVVLQNAMVTFGLPVCPYLFIILSVCMSVCLFNLPPGRWCTKWGWRRAWKGLRCSWSSRYRRDGSGLWRPARWVSPAGFLRSIWRRHVVVRRTWRALKGKQSTA